MLMDVEREEDHNKDEQIVKGIRCKQEVNASDGKNQKNGKLVVSN